MSKPHMKPSTFISYAGAADVKEGLLKAADNGTLFIDEIGDMDLSVQASMLRFMETGSFRPLGSTKDAFSFIPFFKLGR